MGALTFTFFLTFTLLSSAFASTESILYSVADDSLIRQFVEAVDQLLLAEHQISLIRAKYGNTYATQEENYSKLSVLKAYLAAPGATKFSDLTPSKFEKSYLGLHKRLLKLPVDAHWAPVLPSNDLRWTR